MGMIKDSLITAGLIGLLGVGAFQVGKGILNDAIHERTRRAVQLKINQDYNGMVVSKEEWDPVYESLGVIPSANYGLDLSTKQLKQYLEINSSKEGGATE